MKRPPSFVKLSDLRKYEHRARPLKPAQIARLLDLRQRGESGMPADGCLLHCMRALVRKGYAAHKGEMERTFIITDQGRKYLEERSL